MNIYTGASIHLSQIPVEEVVSFRGNPEFKDKFSINIVPSIRYQGIQTRTLDNGLFDVTITFLSGGLSGVAFNLLSSWIYDKYKKNRIKKPMINGVEIDIENISAEEILAIFSKNKTIDAREDSTQE